MGKKQEVLSEIFTICQQRQDYVFDNDLVEKICYKVGFKNKFDVTKLDNKNLLPEILRQNDYALIHLGRGKHQFIKGIDLIYHRFEPIQDYVDWGYRQSLLNDYNSSESNVLSVANNQRILHNFLFGEDKEFEHTDISQRPKTYFPHRTNANLEYYFGETKVNLTRIQIEIDLTIEYKGVIGVFESKNGHPNSFSIYQLYHPFLYYHKAKQKVNQKIQEIIGVYVVRQRKHNFSYLSLWAYTFEDPYSLTSIKLKKSVGYRLVGET